MSLNRFFSDFGGNCGREDEQNEVEWYGAWIRTRRYIYVFYKKNA